MGTHWGGSTPQVLGGNHRCLSADCGCFRSPKGDGYCVVLLEFLTANREEILARARKLVGARNATEPVERARMDGLPLFLNELGDALLLARADGTITQDSSSNSASACPTVVKGRITVRDAIRDYQDLCTAVTELTMERDAPISVQEFVALDLYLDHAIAHAITEWGERE